MNIYEVNLSIATHKRVSKNIRLDNCAVLFFGVVFEIFAYCGGVGKIKRCLLYSSGYLMCVA